MDTISSGTCMTSRTLCCALIIRTMLSWWSSGICTVLPTSRRRPRSMRVKISRFRWSRSCRSSRWIWRKGINCLVRISSPLVTILEFRKILFFSGINEIYSISDLWTVALKEYLNYPKNNHNQNTTIMGFNYCLLPNIMPEWARYLFNKYFLNDRC